MNHLFSGYCDVWWRTRAVRALQVPPDARVLDVCTGTTDLAIALTACHPAMQIYGLDFSANMLDLARQKLIRKRLEQQVHLLRGDALCLPFSENTFDGLLIGFGLRNLLDREGGLREMRRVLKPVEHIVILEFAPPPPSILSHLYRMYVGRIMSVIGKLVSRSPSAYHYLYTSIDQFLDPEALRQLLGQVGFRNVTLRPLMGGFLALHTAQK